MSDDQLITDLAAQQVQKPATTGLGLASATILSWDPTTLSGTLDYQGTVLRDIPVLSGTDALTWRPGDEVILDTWYPPDGHRRRGFGSFMIRGRVVRPGATNAARIVQFLQSELAKQIVDEIVEQLLISEAGQELAAFVIGQRVHAANVTGSGTLAGETSFTTLSGSPGPTLSDVEVSESGVAVVSMSCSITGNLPSGAGSVSGFMGVDISGSTSVSADTDAALRVVFANSDSSGVARADNIRGTYTHKFEGLNPGLHTFSARYRNGGSTTLTTTFAVRSLVVMAL